VLIVHRLTLPLRAVAPGASQGPFSRENFGSNLGMQESAFRRLAAPATSAVGPPPGRGSSYARAGNPQMLSPVFSMPALPTSV
jgi:hypothetical protein